MSHGTGTVLLVLIVGCGGERPAPPPVAPPQPPEPADSLVLTAPGGHTVWLTVGRAARDSETGKPCLERSVEIRSDSSRVRVPLLYTNQPITLLDPRQVRAELTRNCRPMAVYRVDLATGRPTKIADR